MAPLKHPTEKYIELAAKGLGPVEIGKHLKVDEATVRRHLRKLEGSTYAELIDGAPDTPLEGFLDRPIEVDTKDGWGITADWHVPLCDYRYIAQFLDHAQDLQVKNLIIGGDLWNFDGLSSFDSKQKSAGLEVELPEVVRIMGIVLKRFDRVVVCYGNHDARLQKALGYQLMFKDAMRLALGGLGEKLLKRVEFSNLDHVLINAPDRQWRVCHPKSYNRMPLSTAIKLEEVYRQAIITAHSHHAAMGYAKDGTTPVAEIGGLFDASRTEYLQRTTTHPLWSQGYGLMDADGRLVVESPAWSTRLS